MIRKYELVREKVAEYDYNYSVMNSGEVVAFMNSVLKLNKRDREMFVVLCVNAKMEIESVSIESIGDIASSIVAPREIYKNAILSNAQGVIIAHNHPSGNCTPSKEDLATSKRLKEAGELLGIKLLDSIIVGSDDYISFQERGWLND